MIQAALLSNLGVACFNGPNYSETVCRDAVADLAWLMLIAVEPGGVVNANLIRCDPGTMGRKLFHFRTALRDGRHRLEYLSLHGAPISAPLPALPAVCAFFRAARTEMEAGRVPDVEALAPLHLGLAFTLPPIEIRPGDFAICLDFSATDGE